MNWFSIGFTALRWVGGLFTGGSLESILNTIDKGLDDEVTKEQVKADVTKKWIDRQADLLVGRTWWFQLFFVIPLGVWWTAVILDSIFGWERQIAALPNPLDEWAAWIISALFIVDGTKAVLGRLGK
jgi:hypothetical protein